MKPRLIVSPEARSDLVEIWRYLGARSSRAIARVMQEIRARFQMLVDFPESGIRREELRAGLRSFPVENYVIFYFIIDGGVEIVRVLHGRREIEAIFSVD
jgi:toxin ParE1/3/4